MDNEHLFNHRFVTEKQIMTWDCLISTVIYTYTMDRTTPYTLLLITIHSQRLIISTHCQRDHHVNVL